MGNEPDILAETFMRSGTEEASAPPEAVVRETLPLPREALRNFLLRFAAYVKARKLYPPGHARVGKQLEAWLESAKEILGVESEATLFVKRDEISVCKETFDAGDRIVSELAPELIRRMIRFVAVKRGITAEELQVLAEPLLVDHAAILDAGGVLSFLPEGLPEHLLIIEFSFEAEMVVRSEEDIETVRLMADQEDGPQPEREAIKKLVKFDVGPVERVRLAAVLSDDRIQERLKPLRELLSELEKKTDSHVYTNDILVYIVREITNAEEDLGELSEEQVLELAGELLDRLRARLKKSFNEAPSEGRNEILERLARTMMESPGSLIRWLAPKPGDSDTMVSDDASDLLKTIFIRAEEGRKDLEIDGTALGATEVPEEEKGQEEEAKKQEEKEPPKKEKRKAAKPELDIGELEKNFFELQRTLGSTRYEMKFDKVPLAHFDIFLELLTVENKPGLRNRLLKELKARGLVRRTLIVTPASANTAVSGSNTARPGRL